MTTIADYLDALRPPGATRPPARILIAVAHPDDETIGAGGLLALAGDGAAPEVTVLHTTDGAPRDGADALAAGCTDWRAYAALRRAELAAALELAGFPLERVRGLGHADQQAVRYLPELSERLRRHLLRLEPDVVLTHAYEGGHPDHDATAFAVHAACILLRREGRRVPAVVEMPFYHGSDEGMPVFQTFLPDPATAERAVVLDAALRARKVRMLDAFASQRRTLAAFGVERERFRPARPPLFAQPSHAGRTLYDSWKLGVSGERWRALAGEALADLGLEGARWV